MARRRPGTVRRTPPKRRVNTPLRPTQWGHSVAALTLTLLALISWAYVARPETQGLSALPPKVQAAVSQRLEEQKEAVLRSFSIAATGDVLIHGPVADRAARNAGGGSGYDFDPMFERVSPLISDADLAICHMETPISSDNSDVSSYPAFNAPRELAEAIANAGYDLCSTASNHSYDKGPEGIGRTIATLTEAGVRTEGTATNRREARQPVFVDVRGVRLAHLSYTYGLNGFKLPKDQKHLVNIINLRRILRDAARAKDAGAEFVVVSVHWGQEFQTEPTEDQLSGARRLLRSKDIDLVIGHHAHVPHAIKRVGKEFAILGLGNIISNQQPGATATCCPAETQDGLLVRVDVRERAGGWNTNVTYWPTWVRPGSYEILPLTPGEVDDPDLAAMSDDLQASWRRTVATVSSRGASRAGVRPAATLQGSD